MSSYESIMETSPVVSDELQEIKNLQKVNNVELLNIHFRAAILI